MIFRIKKMRKKIQVKRKNKMNMSACIESYGRLGIRKKILTVNTSTNERNI